MKVFIEMPKDTKFKTGDMFLEKGFKITHADGTGKAVHEDLQGIFLRPASSQLAEGDQAKLVELSERLQLLAKELEDL
jgi:hypothetical protein